MRKNFRVVLRRAKQKSQAVVVTFATHSIMQCRQRWRCSLTFFFFSSSFFGDEIRLEMLRSKRRLRRRDHPVKRMLFLPYDVCRRLGLSLFIYQYFSLFFFKVAHPPFVTNRNYPGFFKGISLFSHWHTGVSFIWWKAPTRTGSVREENGALGAAMGEGGWSSDDFFFFLKDLVEDLFFCGARFIAFNESSLRLKWNEELCCVYSVALCTIREYLFRLRWEFSVERNTSSVKATVYKNSESYQNINFVDVEFLFVFRNTNWHHVFKDTKSKNFIHLKISYRNLC